MRNQDKRLSELLEAKKKYEKSKAAVEELVAAGIMSEAEAAKVLYIYIYIPHTRSYFVYYTLDDGV